MVDGYLLLSLPIYKQTRRGNNATSFPIPGYVLFCWVVHETLPLLWPLLFFAFTRCLKNFLSYSSFRKDQTVEWPKREGARGEAEFRGPPSRRGHNQGWERR